MKTGFRIILPALILLAACHKDKFTTDPQVTVKSVSPGEINLGNIFTIDAKYTDKEGDIDSALLVYKWYDGDVMTMVDTLAYPFDGLGLPPKTAQGEITIRFEYGTANTNYLPFSSVSKDTTATFGLILLDKGKHRSNYSESGKVRLKS